MFGVSFWVAVSFVIFISLVYKPVKNKFFDIFDKRAERIRKELDEMNELKQEASRMLAECKKRQEMVDREIEELILNSEQEIKKMKDSASDKIAGYLNRRTGQIMGRISSQEEEIVASLRKEAIETTIKVVNQIIKDKLTDNLSMNLVKDSLEITSKKFH